MYKVVDALHAIKQVIISVYSQKVFNLLYVKKGMWLHNVIKLRRHNEGLYTRNGIGVFFYKSS